MSFTERDRARLQQLIWKQQFGGGLTWIEEGELRNLIARRDPTAENKNVEQLVGLGLLLLAAWALFKK